jgi:hypothetical protein
MNRRIKIITILVLVTLVSAINFSALTKAVTISDQLELAVGSNVTGELFYTNSSVTDHLVAYPTITVEDVITATDVTFEFYKIKLAYEISDKEFFGDELTQIEMTHIVFKHNRTTLLAAARLFMGNASFSVELTVLHLDSVAEWKNMNNTKITFHNGTSYRFGDLDYTSPGYSEIIGYMLGYAIMNLGLSLIWERTLIGINPNANVGDKVNFLDSDSSTSALADIIETTEITTSAGKTIDTIHVEYAYTSLFGWDDYECDAFYETKTGLLVRIIETSPTDTYEFLPKEVKNIPGLIAFPMYGIAIGFIAISLIYIFTRRMRR